MQFPTVGTLIGDAVRLTNQLLDAAESAMLREHAQHCFDVARQLWRSVCHLRDGLPSSEEERGDVDRLCAALSRRIHLLDVPKHRH